MASLGAARTGHLSLALPPPTSGFSLSHPADALNINTPSCQIHVPSSVTALGSWALPTDSSAQIKAARLICMLLPVFHVSRYARYRHVAGLLEKVMDQQDSGWGLVCTLGSGRQTVDVTARQPS